MRFVVFTSYHITSHHITIHHKSSLGEVVVVVDVVLSVGFLLAVRERKEKEKEKEKEKGCWRNFIKEVLYVL